MSEAPLTPQAAAKSTRSHPGLAPNVGHGASTTSSAAVWRMSGPATMSSSLCAARFLGGALGLCLTAGGEVAAGLALLSAAEPSPLPSPLPLPPTTFHAPR